MAGPRRTSTGFLSCRRTSRTSDHDTRFTRHGPRHAWFVLYAVVLAAAAVAEFLLHVPGAIVVGAAVLGVGIALISRWWTRIYVAELRSAA